LNMRKFLFAIAAVAVSVTFAAAQAPPAAAQRPAAAAPAAPAQAKPPAPVPPAAGQAKPAAPAPAAPAEAAPAQAAEMAAAPETYSYQSEGRRDPFLNLLGTGMEVTTMMRHGDGPGSMTVAEVSVRGIMQSRGALIAMIEGPDKKTYVVHQGDKFVDGAIKTITPQGLVLVQEINDPLSLVKHREIRKMLRSIEDAK
jgi:Tfp pilus assembly protein PilP